MISANKLKKGYSIYRMNLGVIEEFKVNQASFVAILVENKLSGLSSKYKAVFFNTFFHTKAELNAEEIRKNKAAIKYLTEQVVHHKNKIQSLLQQAM